MSMLFNCTLMAPAWRNLRIPSHGNPLFYLLALGWHGDLDGTLRVLEKNVGRIDK